MEVATLLEINDSPAAAKAELKAEASMQNDDVIACWQNVIEVNWFSVVVVVAVLLENMVRKMLLKSNYIRSSNGFLIVQNTYLSITHWKRSVPYFCNFNYLSEVEKGILFRSIKLETKIPSPFSPKIAGDSKAKWTPRPKFKNDFEKLRSSCC